MREVRGNGVTVFEDRPVILPAILAAAAIVFAVGLTSHLDALLAGEKVALGILLGVLLCAFGAVLLFRRDRFVFDHAAKRLRWRKWSLASASSGAVAFEDIVDVTMESISGADGGGSYRVALRTIDGSLPMTEFYAGTAEDWHPLADRLRDIIGLDDDRPAGGDTAALLAQGRYIDAIRQVHEDERHGLTMAKEKVDTVERRPG